MENHICKKCGGIAGWDSYYQSWICTRCGNEELKPITNADRIRAMTNEELAKVLHNTGCNWYSEEYWLEWLKQDHITFVAQEYEKDLNDRLNREGIAP